jgi:hypothetical protein
MQPRNTQRLVNGVGCRTHRVPVVKLRVHPQPHPAGCATTVAPTPTVGATAGRTTGATFSAVVNARRTFIAAF